MTSTESDSFLLLCFLKLLTSDESDLSDDESDDDGSDSGTSGMCDFSFSFGEFVVRVRGVGTGVCFLTEMKSTGDVVPLVVFRPK